MPPGTTATASSDLYHEETAVMDGQSEVSVRFAQKIGLLPEKPDKNLLFAAWQIRAVPPMDNGETAFCKGMLTVDPHLEQDIRLRKACRKIPWQACSLAAERLKHFSRMCSEGFPFIVGVWALAGATLQPFLRGGCRRRRVVNSLPCGRASGGVLYRRFPLHVKFEGSLGASKSQDGRSFSRLA